MRVVVFAAMAAFLVVALCVPGAFDDLALAVRAAPTRSYGSPQIALFVASRDDPGLATPSGACWPHRDRRRAAGGRLVRWRRLQGAMWSLALVLDMGGPLVIDPSGWRLEPGHFAERHGLIVIIALGESIVAIGVGAEADIDRRRIAACVAHGDRRRPVVALLRRRRARRRAAAGEGRAGHERNTIARDSYSYLHFLMVAGIVLVALGLKKTLEHVGDPLKDVVPAALCSAESPSTCSPTWRSATATCTASAGSAWPPRSCSCPAARRGRDLLRARRRSWPRCWRR